MKEIKMHNTCFSASKIIENILIELGYDVKYVNDINKADIHLFTIYSCNVRERINNGINLCIYGESTLHHGYLNTIISDKSVYSIGHLCETDDRHFMFPLFFNSMYMDYFGCYRTNSIDIRKYKELRYSNKHTHGNEFCAFCASNVYATLRNNFVKELSKYKIVHCGGPVLHNYDMVNNDNIKFFNNHKFTVCFENSTEKNYLTEKLYNAFISGSVPIYWGCPNVYDYFNKDAFINVTEDNFNEAIEKIKYLDNNEEAYNEMSRQPMFNPNFDRNLWYNELKTWINNILKIYF